MGVKEGDEGEEVVEVVEEGGKGGGDVADGRVMILD